MSEPTLDTPAIERYAEVTMRKRKLQAELREVESNLRALERTVLDDMIAAGVTMVRVADVTVYTQTQTRAKLRDDVERDQAVEGMQRLQLGDLLKVDFNLNTLSAWCREVLDSDAELPSGFDAYFIVERGPCLRVRKSS